MRRRGVKGAGEGIEDVRGALNGADPLRREIGLDALGDLTSGEVRSD